MSVATSPSVSTFLAKRPCTLGLLSASVFLHAYWKARTKMVINSNWRENRNAFARLCGRGQYSNLLLEVPLLALAAVPLNPLLPFFGAVTPHLL
jgi:hypothetical protein